MRYLKSEPDAKQLEFVTLLQMKANYPWQLISGKLVRHLVMPSDIAGIGKIMEFLASEISADTYINVMEQYRPYGNIDPGSEIARHISMEEYRQAIEMAKTKGLHNFL